MKNPHDIILRPVLTEKSYDGMADKRYVFEVAINANKIEIKQAVEAAFGVKVESVNTLRTLGKIKRRPLRRPHPRNQEGLRHAEGRLQDHRVLRRHGAVTGRLTKMAIRVYKPTSPARRFMSVLTFEEVTKTTPEKSLLESKKKNAGRNKQGKITVRHQGGGNKVKYRVIDFKRNKDGIPAKVAGIEYDPNRTAFIALLNYADGEKRYILAADRPEDRRHRGQR